jgi:hypothetical protein
VVGHRRPTSWSGSTACGMLPRCQRDPRLVEHSVTTLIGQRVFCIALGYEDLNDYDKLRHDPLMAVRAGKLKARRDDCAPAAGKSTLNRLGTVARGRHALSQDQPRPGGDRAAVRNEPADHFTVLAGR